MDTSKRLIFDVIKNLICENYTKYIADPMSNDVGIGHFVEILYNSIKLKRFF